MIRLLLPLAGAAAFFVLALATVRLVRPSQPRRFFLAYAAGLLVATGIVYTRLWPGGGLDDRLGLIACLLLQTLCCLTMWNAFYSLLWGFSGGLCYDLFNDRRLRNVDALVHAYEGDGPVDRILARRLPNLVAGGYITFENGVLALRQKGRFMADRTTTLLKILALGAGGGIDPSSHVYRAVVLATAATAIGVWFVASWLAPSLSSDGRVFLSAIVVTAGGLFVHFVTLPDRSVTLRILVELRRAPGETLEVAEMERRYGVRLMIESRVRQLTAGRFLDVDQHRGIRLLPRGETFGRFVTAGRRLFRIESAN